MDIFTASIILANKIMHIGKTAVSYSDVNTLRDIKYVVNNTANDYLLASEELISFTQTKLERTITSKLRSLQIILAFETAAIVIVCVSLILAGKIMVSSYRTLFRALKGIDGKQATERIAQLQRMKKILEKDIESGKFSAAVPEILKSINRNELKLQKGRRREVSREGPLNLASMNLYLTKYIGFSLIVIQVITVLFAVALVDSNSSFKSLQEVNVQLFASTTGQFQSSRLVADFYTEMGYYNDTSVTLRNQPTKAEFMSALDKLSNINAALLSAFSDQQGRITDPVIATIFSAAPCKFLSSAMQTSCLTATAHQNVGLLTLNTAQYSIIRQFMGQFFDHPTDLYLKTYASSIISAQRPIADTIEYTYRFINAHVVSNFELSTSRFLARTNYLHVAIMAVIVVTAVLIWLVTVRVFDGLDISRGKILKVVSFRIMLDNKAVGLYMGKYFLHKNAANKKMR